MIEDFDEIVFGHRRFVLIEITDYNMTRSELIQQYRKSLWKAILQLLTPIKGRA